MADKERLIELPDIGQVKIVKRKQSRRLTLRIEPNGMPRVSVPPYIPFDAGRKFAISQRDWILAHKKPVFELKVPANYELYDSTIVLVRSTKGRNATSHINGKILIKINTTDKPGFSYFMKTIKAFLATDTKNVVGPLVVELSEKIELSPSAVTFKSTTSKWGSCNSRRELVFSSYMAQLPNDLIRYVVIHELCHIAHMNHSSNFWAKVALYDADYKAHRKQLKSYELRPLINVLGTTPIHLA